MTNYSDNCETQSSSIGWITERDNMFFRVFPEFDTLTL